MLKPITITVRAGYGTYTASGRGQRASCTSGPEQAASRLAEKIMGATPYSVRCVTPCVAARPGCYEITPETSA